MDDLQLFGGHWLNYLEAVPLFLLFWQECLKEQHLQRSEIPFYLWRGDPSKGFVAPLCICHSCFLMFKMGPAHSLWEEKKADLLQELCWHAFSKVFREKIMQEISLIPVNVSWNYEVWGHYFGKTFIFNSHLCCSVTFFGSSSVTCLLLKLCWSKYKPELQSCRYCRQKMCIVWSGGIAAKAVFFCAPVLWCLLGGNESCMCYLLKILIPLLG